MLVLCFLEYLKLNFRRERGESHFFKVQEIIKFSEAESKMISSFQPLNMLNLLIIN